MLKTIHAAATCTETMIFLRCPVQTEVDEPQFPLLKKVAASVLELLDLPYKLRHRNRIQKSTSTKTLILMEMNGTCRDYRNRREKRKRSTEKALLQRRMNMAA